MIGAIRYDTIVDSMTYVLKATEKLSYATPILTAGSLFLDENLPLLSGERAVVNLAANNSPRRLTFKGQYFGTNANFVIVTYASATHQYTCSVEEISDTQVTCTTEKGEATGEYVFTITVAGQVSQLGQDVIRFPSSPILRSVAGCKAAGNGTTDCPTRGNVLLTIIGDNLVPDSVADLL